MSPSQTFLRVLQCLLPVLSAALPLSADSLNASGGDRQVSASDRAEVTLPVEPVRYATLKFDDLRPRAGETAVTPIEQAVYERLHAADIPHGWGVYRLDDADNPRFYEWLRARHEEGHEIWHHGNRHDRVEGESWEFKNRSEASQLANLRHTQERIFERTGIVLRTFGAPYNHTDLATGRALNQIEALDIFYFAHGSPNFEGLQLNDRVNLESATGVVASLEDFQASYAEKADAEIIVLQAHPAYWDPETDLPKFDAILEFLRAEGRVFITPSDYLESIQL